MSNPSSRSSRSLPNNPRERSRHLVATRTRSTNTFPRQLTVAVVGTWSRLRNEPDRRYDVQKWEYATVPLITHALQEILNQWGEEGWELVQVVESQATGTTAYLKRHKEIETASG